MIKRPAITALAIVFTAMTACNSTDTPTDKSKTAAAGLQDWPRVESPIPAPETEAKKIDEWLSRMTLEEKVGQIVQAEIQHINPEEAGRYHVGSVLNGGGSQPYRIKGAKAKDWVSLADAFYEASMDPDNGSAIPVMWGTDAVHGHGNVTGATLFPHNVGLGATRNPELVRRIGEATAKEVAVTGLDWVFAPTVAVAQNDRWGRTYESYSEDPAVVRMLGAALVEGLQGRPGSPEFLDEDHVVAGAKHFIADGGTEEGEDQGDARLSERELIEIHNPGYVAAMEAGVQNIMASFSSWNGEKVHGHRYLLTDVLKQRMGFGGFVVSDWNAHDHLPECSRESCPEAINAGVDMIMVPYDWKAFIGNTIEQVRAGVISEARLDEAVRRILRVKLRAGLFDAKPSERANAGKQEILGNPQHRALARRAVRESLVLLKNSNGILPINSSRTVLVAGDGADNIGKQAGGWSVNWQGSNVNADFPGATSIYEGIRQAVESHGGKVVLSEEGDYRRLLDKAPDVAVVVFGENPYAEGQGDRSTLEFEPANKTSLRLLQRLAEAGIPTVSVFLSGRPLWVNPELNASDAFVAAWLPGSEGAGVADVIVGHANGAPRYDFKGRLAFSWPKTPLQDVLNPHHSGYDPLFMLGYGLSYASGGEGPGELPVDVPGVAAAGTGDIDLYVGRPLEPWNVFIKEGERVEILNGSYAELLGGKIEVVTSDKDIQEDALTFTWRDAGDAGVLLDRGPPLDLSSHVPGGVMAFDFKADSAPEGELQLVLRCGPDCERRFPLTGYAAANAGKGWRRIAIDLACLAEQPDALKRVVTPFMLEATGTGQVSFANIRFLKSGEATESCPH